MSAAPRTRRRLLLPALSALVLLLNSCEVTSHALDAPSWSARDRTYARGSDQRESIFWHGFRIQADTLTTHGARGRVKIRFPGSSSISTALADEVRLTRNDRGTPVLVLDGGPVMDGQRGKLDLVTGADGTSIAVTPDLRYHVHGAAKYGKGRL